MSFVDRDSECGRARLYYCDLLSPANKNVVPETVREHVADCPHCQAEIDQLSLLLTDAKDQVAGQKRHSDSAIGRVPDVSQWRYS